MALSDARAYLLARREKYQAALLAATLQPDMMIDRKRTFRADWIKALEDALESIEKQLQDCRDPFNVRVGVESI